MTENTFCRTLPTQPKIWDPSRLGPFMTCHRKHYLQTIRGLRKNGRPSVHLEWGSAYHDCTELFDNLITDGWECEKATEDAMACAFTLSWDLELGHSRWQTRQEMVRCTSPAIREHKRQPGVMVKNTERCHHARSPCPEHGAMWVEINHRGVEFCGDCGAAVERFVSFTPDHPKKTRHTLLRAVLLYCDTEGALKPYQFEDGTPGCEIQFRVPLPINSPDPCTNLDGHTHEKEPCPICHGTGFEPYELLVNLDSLVTWETPDEILIRERKTTSRPKLTDHYWAGFLMNPQVDTYDLVGNAVLGVTRARPLGLLLEAMRVGTKDAEIQRIPIHISEERRAEWLMEVCGYIKDAENLAQLAYHNTENLVWMAYHKATPEVMFKRNTAACMGAFGRCQFWGLCSEPASQREAIIAADYHEERWDPISCSSVVQDEDETL